MKKATYFHFFALKTDNSLFCNWDIPTIHNGYCVSNAVIMQRKLCFTNDLSTEIRIKGSVIIDFSTEHNLTIIYR